MLGGFNETGWEDAKFISLLDCAQKEVNSQKRSELLLEAEELFMDQMVVIPLYHYAFDFVTQERVKDVALSPLGLIDFKWAKKS